MKIIKKTYFILSSNQKKTFLLVSIYSFVQTLLEVIGIGLVFPILTILLDFNLFLSFVQKYNFLQFLTHLNQEIILFYSLFFLVIFYFIKNTVSIIINNFKYKSFFELIASISASIFSGYLSQPMFSSTKVNSSYLIRNILDIPTWFVNNVLNGFYTIFFEILLIIGAISIFYSINEYLALSLIIIIVSFVLFFNFKNKKKLLTLGADLNISHNERLKTTQEMLEGIKDINIYNKKDFYYKLFQKNNLEISSITSKLAFKEIIPRYILEFSAVSILAITIIFLSKANLSGKEIVPIISVLAAGLIKLVPAIAKILSSLQRIKSNTPITENLYDETLKFRNIEKNINLPIHFNKSILVQDVRFAYNEDKIILDNLNLEIKKNSLFGIKGASGKGKTTVLNLILGFLNPIDGNIQVDNIKISQNIKNWQKLIGYVPQKTFIANDTLKQNIAFGENYNEIDNSSVERAIALSKLDDFVDALPNGLNEIINEKGQNISGGQIQRIGIARALYRNPKLLILDEPTSSLDKDSEKEIFKNLLDLKENLTIILVSHNPELIKLCDNILDLDK